MKILASNISHKSDAGGVRLNIDSAAEVRRCYRELIDQVREHQPEADIRGVTIEKMYRSSTARELMIGIKHDPVFGPVISFGSGGTMVEVMGDVAIALPPLNRQLAIDLIQHTRVNRLLGKFRHLPAANMELLIDVLLRISNIACELPWIQEMDINPLMIDENAAVAVDARIRVDYPQLSTDPYHHLAIHPYPAHLVSRVQLRDGEDILIRPIRPEDAEIEKQFINNLSDEAKYFRFMNALHELTQEMLVRFTQIDYHYEMALIAVRQVGDNEEEIGVARYATNPDKISCEFALVVSDVWQHKGIGHHLMIKLIQTARDRGLEVMQGEILSSNVKMLEMIDSLGFRITNDPDEHTIKRAELSLHT
jgi:acetyltransferase